MGQGLSSALVFIFVNPLAVSSLRSTEIEFRNLPLIGREISGVANGEFFRPRSVVGGPRLRVWDRVRFSVAWTRGRIGVPAVAGDVRNRFLRFARATFRPSDFGPHLQGARVLRRGASSFFKQQVRFDRFGPRIFHRPGFVDHDVVRSLVGAVIRHWDGLELHLDDFIGCFEGAFAVDRASRKRLGSEPVVRDFAAPQLHQCCVEKLSFLRFRSRRIGPELGDAHISLLRKVPDVHPARGASALLVLTRRDLAFGADISMQKAEVGRVEDCPLFFRVWIFAHHLSSIDIFPG